MYRKVLLLLLKAIELMEQEEWRLRALWKNTKQLKTALAKGGIPTGHSQSPVIPVICGENEKAFKLSKGLFDKGFLANAVVYPAVPFQQARLRICSTVHHTPEIIADFAAAVIRLCAPLH